MMIMVMARAWECHMLRVSGLQMHINQPTHQQQQKTKGKIPSPRHTARTHVADIGITIATVYMWCVSMMRTLYY